MTPTLLQDESNSASGMKISCPNIHGESCSTTSTLFNWAVSPPPTKSAKIYPLSAFEAQNGGISEQDSEHTRVPPSTNTIEEHQFNSEKPHFGLHGFEESVNKNLFPCQELIIPEPFCEAPKRGPLKNFKFKDQSKTRATKHGTLSHEESKGPDCEPKLSYPTYLEEKQSPNSNEQHTKSKSQNDGTQTPAVNPEDKKLVEHIHTLNQFENLSREINGHNFSVLLVKVLREFHNQISLCDLFDILYNNHHPGTSPALYSPSCQKPNVESSQVNSKGLEFCQFIVELFANPRAKRDHELFSIGRLGIGYINFHEFLRTFLAVQIIFTCISKADHSSRSGENIQKLAVYKAYYILCQRLIRERRSTVSHADQSLILGQSKFGQLSKLIHPDLISKRLGKRGKSKFHYMDVRWNRLVIDEEVLKLTELELPHLRSHFTKVPKEYAQKLKFSPLQRRLPHEPMGIISMQERQKWIHSRSQFLKPEHSYAELTHTYPQIDCAPRDWEATPESVPGLSKWSQVKMQTSLKILSTHKIDLKSLIEGVKSGTCFNEYDNTFSVSVFKALSDLQNISAEKEMFMHLYLVVLLLIFPVIIASDEEVLRCSKMQFRISINSFISALEADINNRQRSDDTSLETFIGTLKMMMRVIELTSCQFQFQYQEAVLKEMIHDVEEFANDGKYITQSTLEETFISPIIISMNAYNFEPIHRNTGMELDIIENISSLAESLKNSVVMYKQSMMSLVKGSADIRPNSLGRDVPYQVFRIAIQDFHGVTLADPLLSQLPIPVITFIMCQQLNKLQHTSFQAFGRRDPELSKNTFKAWWVFSTMLQEYMKIISEVVALSDTLDQKENCEG